MPFCPSCGTSADGKFCPKCGTAIGAAPPPPPPGYAPPPPGYQQPGYQQPGYPPPPQAFNASGLSSNIAAMLCYIVPVVCPIIFLVVDPYKSDRKVRFDAFQSLFPMVRVYRRPDCSGNRGGYVLSPLLPVQHSRPGGVCDFRPDWRSRLIRVKSSCFRLLGRSRTNRHSI